MKEDVIAANLANLRQSVNELKETVNNLNKASKNHEQTAQSAVNEQTICNSVEKSFYNCWNDALSVVKKHIWKQQPDTLPFSLWFPKLIELFKQKSKFLEYLYRHVCDYNLNRMTIEANTGSLLKRQDEILAELNKLRCSLTIIPTNANGLFIRGYHFKLRYVVIVVIAILTWAMTASICSMKYKEEAFAYYSMYRVIEQQYQHLIDICSPK